MFAGHNFFRAALVMLGNLSYVSGTALSGFWYPATNSTEAASVETGDGGTLLTLADFASDEILQRAPGGTTKTIPISGTYTDQVAGIQCSVKTVRGGTVLGWTDATNYVASSGHWSAKCPNVPQGSWYTMKVRDAKNNSVTASGSHAWGVGVVVWMIGQSNMQRMWGAGEGAIQPSGNGKVKAWNGTSWVDPRDASIGTGAGYSYYGHFLQMALGGTVPVGIIPSALGGSSITTWRSGASSWIAATSPKSHGISICQINAPCDAEVVLWQQGETDSESKSPVGHPARFYFSTLKSIHQQSMALFGRNSAQMHFGTASLGNFEDTDAEFSDAYVNSIRSYELSYGAGRAVGGISPLPGSFYLSSMIDLIRYPSDSQHWTTGQVGQINSYWIAARRFALSTEKAMGLIAHGAEGPYIADVSWPIGTRTITVTAAQQGGSGLTSGNGDTRGSGLLGFVVFGTSATVVSTAFLQPNKIILTMSANRVMGDVPALTYGANRNPFKYSGNGDETRNSVTFDNQTVSRVFNDGRASYDDTGFPLQLTDHAIPIP
jgi:hypothetical protein